MEHISVFYKKNLNKKVEWPTLVLRGSFVLGCVYITAFGTMWGDQDWYYVLSVTVISNTRHGFPAGVKKNKMSSMKFKIKSLCFIQ